MPTMQKHYSRLYGTRCHFIFVIILLALLSAGCGIPATPSVLTPHPTSTFLPLPTRTPTLSPVARPWDVSTVGDTLSINYGQSAGTVPQFGALDLRSGYLQLLPTPTAGWGTAILLLPAFWERPNNSNSASQYYQGAPVQVEANLRGQALVLTITGKIGGLSVTTILQLDPPTTNPPQIHVHVTTTTSGRITLDTTHTSEVFKLVMLSSMHISAKQWDASDAIAEGQNYPLPPSGWIIFPAITGSTFGLDGGTSDWKKLAPTVTIALDTARTITGLVAADTNPNDENVGYWAASDDLPSSWSYDITVAPAT